ncbi:hypothetical protein J6590_013157 [Homalodisca vitripennis]|nr:hypothetical protein J6590_013157 [Homalodisca vitripennis]
MATNTRNFLETETETAETSRLNTTQPFVTTRVSSITLYASLQRDTTRMIARPARRVHSIIAGMLGSVFSVSGAGDGGLIFPVRIHFLYTTNNTPTAAICLQAKRTTVTSYLRAGRALLFIYRQLFDQNIAPLRNSSAHNVSRGHFYCQNVGKQTIARVISTYTHKISPKRTQRCRSRSLYL